MRLGDQRAGQRDPLALATRKRIRPALGEVTGPQLFEHGEGGDPRTVVAPRGARQPELHVVEHAQVREQSVALGHVAHPSFLGREVNAPVGVEQDAVADRDGPGRWPVGPPRWCAAGWSFRSRWGPPGRPVLRRPPRARPVGACRPACGPRRARLCSRPTPALIVADDPLRLPVATPRRPATPRPTVGRTSVSAAHRRPAPAATAATTRPRRPPGSARRPSSRRTATAASTRESATAAWTSDSSAV